MSHVVHVVTKCRDATAVAAACRRLGLPEAVQGKAKLFSDEVEGLIVQLPGWQYPVAIDTASGEMRYDDYGGAWGDGKEMARFMQAYAAEAVRLEACKKGYAVTEQTLGDGSIRLTVVEGT